MATLQGRLSNILRLIDASRMIDPRSSRTDGRIFSSLSRFRGERMACASKKASGLRIITGLPLGTLPPPPSGGDRKERNEIRARRRLRGEKYPSARLSEDLRAHSRPWREGQRGGQDVDTFSSPSPGFSFPAASGAYFSAVLSLSIPSREERPVSPRFALSRNQPLSRSFPPSPVCRSRSRAFSLFLSSSLRARSAHSI